MNERYKSFSEINQEMIFKLKSARTAKCGMIYSPFDIIKLLLTVQRES